MSNTAVSFLSRSIHTTEMNINEFLEVNNGVISQETFFVLRTAEEFCKKAADALKNEKCSSAN